VGAIQREKTVKHWPRAWTVRLIHAINAQWNDLYETIGSATLNVASVVMKPKPAIA